MSSHTKTTFELDSQHLLFHITYAMVENLWVLTLSRVNGDRARFYFGNWLFILMLLCFLINDIVSFYVKWNESIECLSSSHVENM